MPDTHENHLHYITLTSLTLVYSFCIFHLFVGVGVMVKKELCEWVVKVGRVSYGIDGSCVGFI